MVGEEKDKLACAICRSYLQVLAGEEVMDCLIYEQLEPTPIRTFKHGEKDYTEYAANFRLVKRLDNVRWKGLAWDEAKKLVAHPVLQFIGEE
jgi:hypothetical protein